MTNLPIPSPVKGPSEVDVWDLWREVVNDYKTEYMQPHVWRALETVIPIVIDGNQCIVGLPVAAGDFSSLLQANDLRMRLERFIEFRCSYPLHLLIISGTEESDWEDEKRRAAAAKTAQDAFRHRFDPSPANADAAASSRFTGRGVTWDALSERVNVMFSRAKGHHLPQGRVRYLKEVIPVVDEMSRQLMNMTPDEGAANERHLARVLEKVANLVETPSAVVALELARYQASQEMEGRG